jgi:hypothetical protein
VGRVSAVGCLVLGGALLLGGSVADAALNEPIAFSQAGTVKITLDASSGGLDHILEMASTSGAVGTPIFALTDIGAPSADVLGYLPASLGDMASLGSFAAGEELGFRLTNVESARLGTPGTLTDQTFSGTASSSNPNPADYYTFVETVDPLTLRVYWEDLFPIAVDDPDPENAFLANDYDVAFTLTLTPLPEPGSLVLVGGALLFGLQRFKRRAE